MLKKIVLAVLTLCIVASIMTGCSSKYKSKSGDRVDMWQKDIDYIVDELPKKHKNLFFKMSEQEFKSRNDKLKASISSMNDDEVKIELQKIVASAGDGHTSTNISAAEMYPLDLYWFDDSLYVINTSEEYKEIMYAKLKKINDRDFESIVKSISEVISHENDMQIKSQMRYYIAIPAVLRGLHIIGDPQNTRFAFEDRDGKPMEVALNPVNGEEVFNNILGKGKSGENLPLYMKNSDKNYWYEHLEDQNTVYFKYNRCRDMKERSFKDFSKELMDVINKEDIKKLVIDLRDNGGGSSPILDPFINELSDTRLNREGKIFVIIGRKTFSSAVLNAISLKQKTNAVFIGEPTGGKPNHFGEVKRLKLPNTGINVTYSTKYFTNSKDDGPSFMPQVTIQVSVNDYINNYNPVIDYALKH